VAGGSCRRITLLRLRKLRLRPCPPPPARAPSWLCRARAPRSGPRALLLRGRSSCAEFARPALPGASRDRGLPPPWRANGCASVSRAPPDATGSDRSFCFHAGAVAPDRLRGAVALPPKHARAYDASRLSLLVRAGVWASTADTPASPLVHASHQQSFRKSRMRSWTRPGHGVASLGWRWRGRVRRSGRSSVAACQPERRRAASGSEARNLLRRCVWRRTLAWGSRSSTACAAR
jgi:hypothetical protein